MNYCTNCGHALGVGRFCTNCGTPVPGRHPGAAPSAPAAPAAADPTPVSSIPPAARYPLYADTPLGQAPTAPPPATVATASPTEPAAPGPAPAQTARGRSSRGLVIAAVLLALLVAGAGWAATTLFTSDGSRTTGAGPTQGTSATSASPTQDATDTAKGHRHHVAGSDLSGEVTDVQVPATAPASADLSGNKVTFGARNMVDGDVETAWRMTGDGAGGSITLTFGQPVDLTSVGLINGYSKKYPGYNGYWLNRKVTEVRWTFEDGSTVTQRLRRVTRMQTIPVHAGPTSSIKIDILATVPSNKPNSRDYTAISELALIGSTD